MPTTRRTEATLLVPPGTQSVSQRAAAGRRVPSFEPTLGIPLALPAGMPEPPNRLVALGDSVSQGFQSGAVHATDLSFPARPTPAPSTPPSTSTTRRSRGTCGAVERPGGAGPSSTSPACWTGLPRAVTSRTRRPVRRGGPPTRCRRSWPRSIRSPTRASSPVTAPAAGRPAGCSRSTACTRPPSAPGRSPRRWPRSWQMGVQFRTPNGTPRAGPVTVDVARLLQRDLLVRPPPQLVRSTLDALGWADDMLGWVGIALP